jgi:uncharacterized membrane protein YjjP (DUF1212 family)
VELKMPTINQLPLITQLSFGDNLVLWVPNQGDSRRASITTFVSFIETGFTNIVCQTVKTTPVTFANLPTAATAGAGARAFISDGTSGTFGAAAAGGGSAVVPVWSNGTSWYVG